jgi:hypothetical protein
MIYINTINVSYQMKLFFGMKSHAKTHLDLNYAFKRNKTVGKFFFNRFGFTIVSFGSKSIISFYNYF